jgi:hypothetical protein
MSDPTIAPPAPADPFDAYNQAIAAEGAKLDAAERPPIIPNAH